MTLSIVSSKGPIKAAAKGFVKYRECIPLKILLPNRTDLYLSLQEASIE